MSEEQQLIYVKDDSRYNVNSFTDEAKMAFAYLVEINQEINMMTKRIAILRAAAITLSQVVDDQLTSNMLIANDKIVDESDTLAPSGTLVSDTPIS
mgnify:CR=1 FL=1